MFVQMQSLAPLVLPLYSEQRVLKLEFYDISLHTSVSNGLSRIPAYISRSVTDRPGAFNLHLNNVLIDKTEIGGNENRLSWRKRLTVNVPTL